MKNVRTFVSVPHTRAPCDAWLALHSPYAAMKPPARVPRVSARCVFLQALHSPRTTLRPSARVPIMSVRRLVRPSPAFTRSCHSCLPDTWLRFVLDSPPALAAMRVCPPLVISFSCPFPRASAICVCAKSHARCPGTSLVLLFPSLPRACPTLGASFSCLHALVPLVSARHSVALCLGFPTWAG